MSAPPCVFVGASETYAALGPTAFTSLHAAFERIWAGHNPALELPPALPDKDAPAESQCAPAYDTQNGEHAAYVRSHMRTRSVVSYQFHARDAELLRLLRTREAEPRSGAQLHAFRKQWGKRLEKHTFFWYKRLREERVQPLRLWPPPPLPRAASTEARDRATEEVEEDEKEEEKEKERCAQNAVCEMPAVRDVAQTEAAFCAPMAPAVAVLLADANDETQAQGRLRRVALQPWAVRGRVDGLQFEADGASVTVLEIKNRIEGRSQRAFMQHEFLQLQAYLRVTGFARGLLLDSLIEPAPLGSPSSPASARTAEKEQHGVEEHEEGAVRFTINVLETEFSPALWHEFVEPRLARLVAQVCALDADAARREHYGRLTARQRDAYLRDVLNGAIC